MVPGTKSVGSLYPRYENVGGQYDGQLGFIGTRAREALRYPGCTHNRHDTQSQWGT